MILLLVGCAQQASDTRADGFLRADGVRVLSPTNGETVQSPFTLTFEAGADVAAVHLESDGDLAVSSVATEGSGELIVELDAGSRQLALVGEGDGGDELSRHQLTVRVADVEESWVTISSPADGSEVPNPVSFAVEASEDVERVQLLADGWAFGEVAPGEILTYAFTGTGYARTIEAQGLSGEDVIALDSVSITVEPASEPSESSFNDLVIAMLESYPIDGTHGYYWPEGDDWYGTTRDLYYQDVRIAEGDPEGRCFCVGLTWEVFMRVFDQVDRMTGGDGSLNGISVEEMDEFRKDWFVRDLWGTGAVEAFENYGLGERVTDWSDMRPGDFVQFWRHTGSGHNVIFIDWVTDGDGDNEGIYYWTTSESTDGIGYRTEYFGSSGDSIDPSYFFAARMWMPEDWLYLPGPGTTP